MTNFASDQSSLQVVCFDVAGKCYALPVSSLREIVPYSGISVLPDAPPLVEGLVDLRGMLIPVIDLARVTGVGKTSLGQSSRVVVISSPDLVLGICVDAATEVVTVGAAQCEEVPAVAKGEAFDIVHSVIRREGQSPIMILSIDGLVAAVRASGQTVMPNGEAAA